MEKGEIKIVVILNKTLLNLNLITKLHGTSVLYP